MGVRAISDDDRALLLQAEVGFTSEFKFHLFTYLLQLTGCGLEAFVDFAEIILLWRTRGTSYEEVPSERLNRTPCKNGIGLNWML